MKARKDAQQNAANMRYGVKQEEHNEENQLMNDTSDSDENEESDSSSSESESDNSD